MNKKVFSFSVVFLLVVVSAFAITLTRDATQRVLIPIAARGEVCPWDAATESCIGPNQEMVFGNAEAINMANESHGMLLFVLADNVYRSTGLGVFYAEGTVPPGGTCCNFSHRYALLEEGACEARGYEAGDSSNCPSPPIAGLTCCNVAGEEYQHMSGDDCSSAWGATPAVEAVDMSNCDLSESGPLGLRGKASMVNPDGSEVYTTGETRTYTDEKGSVDEEIPIGEFYVTYEGLEIDSSGSGGLSITADVYTDLMFTLNSLDGSSNTYKLQSIITTVEDLEWVPGCSTDADCAEGQVCDDGACKNL